MIHAGGKTMPQLYFEKRKFAQRDLDSIKTVHLNNYPILYILHSQKKSVAYIGQTVHKNRRLRDHLKDPRRKVHEEAIVIGHEQFNQSATYNMESNLINYFIADGQYMLQNVSQTASRQMHNYFQKSYFNEDVFENIWEKLREENIARDSLETLRNKDIFKLSPYKELSEQQLDVKNQVLAFCRSRIGLDGHHVFIVEGDAGTGKSVLLSSLFNTLQDFAKEPSDVLHGTDNYLLVNHSEMLKTYKTIANSLPNLKKKNFMKPTPFVNQMTKEGRQVDIVLIDEAHLLLTKEDAYNNFHYDNHLTEIIERSKITVLIFDKRQVLKLKSYWDGRLLEEITRHYNAATMQLTEQFRMNAGPEVVEWVEQFLNRRILPLPPESETYDFRVYDDPNTFKRELFARNEEHGLSRIVSTFDYLHKKDGADYFVDKGGIDMPWNRTDDSMTWAEQADTINEVGSIYTIQGFDLNYVGVVLGPSVSYDETTDRLVIDPSKYQDRGAFVARSELSEAENARVKEDIVLNSINVLMKRGISGLYLYAADPKLRDRLQQLKGEAT